MAPGRKMFHLLISLLILSTCCTEIKLVEARSRCDKNKEISTSAHRTIDCVIIPTVFYCTWLALQMNLKEFKERKCCEEITKWCGGIISCQFKLVCEVQGCKD